VCFRIKDKEKRTGSRQSRRWQKVCIQRKQYGSIRDKGEPIEAGRRGLRVTEARTRTKEICLERQDMPHGTVEFIELLRH